MGACCDCFEALDAALAARRLTALERAEQVRAKGSQTLVAWESESASSLSPGPLAANERLRRVVLAPTYVESDTGKIKPSFFDDMKASGFSCDRDRRPLEESRAAAEALAAAKTARLAPEKEPVRSFGYVAFEVGAIRQLMSQAGERLCVAFDTAEPTNIHHAEIFLVSSDSAALRRVRSLLVDVANGYVRWGS